MSDGNDRENQTPIFLREYEIVRIIGPSRRGRKRIPADYVGLVQAPMEHSAGMATCVLQDSCGQVQARFSHPENEEAAPFGAATFAPPFVAFTGTLSVVCKLHAGHPFTSFSVLPYLQSAEMPNE